MRAIVKRGCFDCTCAHAYRVAAVFCIDPQIGYIVHCVDMRTLDTAQTTNLRFAQQDVPNAYFVPNMYMYMVSIKENAAHVS